MTSSVAVTTSVAAPPPAVFTERAPQAETQAALVEKTPVNTVPHAAEAKAPALLDQPPASPPYSLALVPFSNIVVLEVRSPADGEVLFRIPDGYNARIAPVRNLHVRV